MDILTLIQKIIDAADALDRPLARELTDELIVRLRGTQDPIPLKQARKVVEALRQKRYLDLVQRLADTLIQTGHEDARIRRNYAQALIDEGSRTAAILVLEKLVAETEKTDRVEHAEARGLVGRAYKQLYMDAGQPELERNRELLRTAVRAYYPLYEEDPVKNDWHGINTVALLKRAARDGVPIGEELPSADALAGKILDRIDALDPPVMVWEAATALEACVALGRQDEAVRWAKEYSSSSAEPFQLGSTLRQLTEVWQLDTSTSKMGAAVLPILRNRLLTFKDGFFEISVDEVRQPSGTLEKVLGADDFQTLGWYTNGLKRARPVARIGRDTSRGDGTGFLVRGGDLLDELGDELFLLTNAHVVSDNPEHNPAVPRPADAWIRFDALEGEDRDRDYRVREVLFSSAPGELDFALLRLEPAFTAAAQVELYPLASGLPANDGKQRVYIIGHPDGGTLSFSMHDNHLLDYDARLMHYRTPTTGGSSGSPVFNAYWQLVGLHHAGYYDVTKLNNRGGTYAANEGISIFAIREALKARATQPVPAPG